MSAPGLDIDIVVVAYGPPQALADALTALGDNGAVVVVDNSSSPATAAVTRSAGARYVDPGTNLGFAAAVNVAIETLSDTPRDMLLLNPDARIEPDQLAQLHRELLAHPDVACVAPAQHAPGSTSPSRARWPWHTPAGAWAEAVGLSRRRLESSSYFLGGAVLLLRKAALVDVGKFDERFFLYSEDEDWQRRAVDRGWHILFCPGVAAEHATGGTETDGARLRLRLHAGIERYVRKWHGSWGWALYRAGTLFGLALRLVVQRGPRRASTADLARVYLTGPDRAARAGGGGPSELSCAELRCA